MRLSYLLSVLAVFVCCTYGDVSYGNNAVGLELSIDFVFTSPVATTGGADIYVVIPEDFNNHGETVNITSSSMNVDSVLATTAATSELRVSFHVHDDLVNAAPYSFTVRGVYSPRAAAVAQSTAASVDVCATGVSPSPTCNVVTTTALYTSASNFVYGNNAAGANEVTAAASNTYLVAARSFLNTNQAYTVSSIELASFNGNAFTADSTAALKVYTRSANSNTLTFVSSTTFSISAGSSPVTINFNNGPRPSIPSNAVIGVYTTNALSLSDAAAGTNFGGHYMLAGNANTNQDATLAWGAKELALRITRLEARTTKDLTGISVSTGTLTPAFAANTFAYTVSLSSPVSLTVSATVDAALGATAVISPAGATSLAAGTTTLFTITVTAEDSSVAANVYTVNVTVAASAPKPPFPCFGLVGTLNRVGYWTGAHFDKGVFDATKCALSVLGNLQSSTLPPSYVYQTAQLAISSNYLRSGLFFGVLVAGGFPDPLPSPLPALPVTPFTTVTARFTDQFGQNSTVNPSGGTFNFPNPDLPGITKLVVTGTINYAPGVTFTLVYDITIVIQKVSVVRTLLPSSGIYTNILTAKVYMASGELARSDFGQFVISASTALGSPFDPWRMLVTDSASDANGAYIVVGFMDNQDKTRVSTSTADVLRNSLVAAINDDNNAYNAKLRTLGGNLAINFGLNAAVSSTIQSTSIQVTPCDNGLWYLYGDTNSVPAVTTAACGAAPNPLSSSSSDNKHVIADALVGLFVGFALLIVVAGFIYYKWIAKSSPSDTATGKGGMELNTMPADAPTNAPVAVPAAQLPPAETSTS